MTFGCLGCSTAHLTSLFESKLKHELQAALDACETKHRADIDRLNKEVSSLSWVIQWLCVFEVCSTLLL